MLGLFFLSGLGTLLGLFLLFRLSTALESISDSRISPYLLALLQLTPLIGASPLLFLTLSRICAFALLFLLYAPV